MWCRNCSSETKRDICEYCGSRTSPEVPYEVHWCDECRVPIVRAADSPDRDNCPLCGKSVTYMSADLRPVFPEERLLLEVILGTPLKYVQDSVWASRDRYYINGRAISIGPSVYRKLSPDTIRKELRQQSARNNYDHFNESVKRFVRANETRLNDIRDEATSFVQTAASEYAPERIVISFSGGKDSTVTADLVTRALENPSLLHIFGNTTLEFPQTLEYVSRFRAQNPKVILKTAMNRSQDFYEVCKDIGPPARMLRWCCSMFKTGPINRELRSLYRDVASNLTFYGIRKCESVNRSRYNRIEDGAESLKIQRQRVASPIFFWKDIDVWLYILGEGLDFNETYRLGYDRVGCWCCPNNNERAQFLSKVYMPEQSAMWRDFLVGFARRIGKQDAEHYVDTGKWKARQGGNGLESSKDIKIRFSNCTAEENAKIYQLNRPMDDTFIGLLTPFGRIAPALGRKMINETIVVHLETGIPVLSVQPFSQGDYEFSVKVKTMNVGKHDDLQRMVGYQVRKFNACRKCLKCESLCRYGAISITPDSYTIDSRKCRRCRVCVSAKYLDGGCLMEKCLRAKE